MQNSANAVAGMLSVKPAERGVASGIRLTVTLVPQIVALVFVVRTAICYWTVLIHPSSL